VTLSKSILEARSLFFKRIRDYFHKEGFWEMDSPILKPIPGMEPHLDPFQVSSPDGKERGYLVTSPEYSLKSFLAQGFDKIFELSHSFRSGELGSPIHSSEFILLEFYEVGIDEQGLVKRWEDLMAFLLPDDHKNSWSKIKKTLISVEELFIKYLNIEDDFQSIKSECLKKEYTIRDDLEYSDYFFLLFLNSIEPHLREGVYYIHSYPPELASLAKITNGRARRVEIYWDGIELGNGFFELNDPKEQRNRFTKEQIERKLLGKEVFPIDEEFLKDLSQIPDCSGIAIGLDRVFMKIMGGSNLKELSPYAQISLPS
jgi:lysyl-tRNA synthetase class 2